MKVVKLRNEEWKTLRKDDWVDGAYYLVSNYGRVISSKDAENEKLLKPYKVAGYHYFMTKTKEGKNVLVYIHRAVAELFLEQPEDKPFVIHKNFDKLNNEVENLMWVNRKELTAHNANNPLVIKGKEKKRKNPAYSKLNEAKVKLLKRKIFDPNRKTRLRLIAKQFGISEMQLYRIKSGENWSHVEP